MFVVWMAIHGRLMTQDILLIWNKDNSMLCSLCKTCMDSHNHLFFQCPYSAKVWKVLKEKIKGADIPNDWTSIINSKATKFHNMSIKSVLSKIVLGVAVYYIWKERNKRQFTNERRNVDDLSRIILDTVRLKLSSNRYSPLVERLNNQMRERLGNVDMELWSGAKWVFALG
ncbi:reverse transcriptase domain, reverse transcriptase zinc-binding domain protein [Tanacetum coccineum]